jgi:hypothetical protein
MTVFREPDGIGDQEHELQLLDHYAADFRGLKRADEVVMHLRIAARGSRQRVMLRVHHTSLDEKSCARSVAVIG